MTARSRSRRRKLPSLALALALPCVSGTAVAGNGWFTDRCPDRAEIFPPTPQRLLLHVLRDPRDDGEDLLLLRLPDGQLYAPKRLFEFIGIAAPEPPLRRGDEAWYRLDAVDGLRYAVNACEQTLSVDASPLRARDVRRLLPERQTRFAHSEPGGYAQADLQYLHARGHDTVSGLLDAGLFGPYGLAGNTLLYDGERAVRLDTSWTVDDPLHLRRLRLGDGITRGGAFGRALRFAGAQWGTDFSLQPDIVTFPLPGVTASAALPSAVDVYVDGTLRAHQDVDAGPFQLERIPVITGGGQIQLVVTDLLGRSSVYRYDFYASQQLLRAGLDDYTVEAGSERRDYGRESLHYGDAFAAGTWRRGLSDWLTGELHAEASADRQVYGAGAAYLLPYLGVLGGGLAFGSGDSHGLELSAGLERNTPAWSYGASYTRTPRSLRRVGEIEPASLQRTVVRGSRQLAGLGSLSLAWLEDRGPDGTRLRGFSFGGNARLWHQGALAVGGFADVSDHQRSSLYANLSWTFGRTLSGGASWQRNDGDDVERVSVQRARLESIGWDAGAYVEHGASTRVGGSAALTDPRAIVRTDVERDADGSAVRVGLRSGVVGLGPDWFWTRPTSGPFAVVETGGAEAVRIYDENRLAGTTGADGRLLVPDLRPYEPRRIAIADSDFAIDARLDETARRIEAPGYGGIRVRLGAPAAAARRIRLRLADGRPPPPGSDVAAAGLAPRFTGRGGELLLDGRPGNYALDVRWHDGQCSARAALRAEDRLSDAPLDVPCTVRPLP